MRTERYYIQSEHVRGERRLYWVCDSDKNHAQVTNLTTDKRVAERKLKKLLQGEGMNKPVGVVKS